MNRLQYLLLKVIEESGEIAEEVLNSGLSAQVHSEIDDLETVLRLIGKEFNTQSILHGRTIAQEAHEATLFNPKTKAAANISPQPLLTQ